MNGSPFLIAATADATRTVIEFTRLRQFYQWWHWIALVGVCAAVLTFVVRFYRRDTTALPRGVRWGLFLLRTFALLGLLVFFLDLQRRDERQITRPSTVAALVDTSQSMGLVDTSSGATESRLQEIIREFREGTLLPTLLKKHDVVVYRFDNTSQPEQVASFTRESQGTTEADTSTSDERMLSNAGWFYLVALALLGIALLSIVAQLVAGRFFRGAEGEAYPILVATVATIAAIIVASVVSLRYPRLSVAEVWNQSVATETNVRPPASTENSSESGTDDDAETQPEQPHDVDWQDRLIPRGVETRLGDAIQSVIDRETSRPLSGLLVMTDGCHNAGIAPESIVGRLTQRDIPVFPFGIGSEKQPQQVRLVDLEVPQRVYPGDRFNVTGYVQADGLEGQNVRVVVSRQRESEDTAEIETDRQITLGKDGEITPIQFEVVPDQSGRESWTMKVEATDAIDLDQRDNVRSGTVQVVERKNRVLLLAGGPMREYRFLRNLLFRDPTTQVDVLLQTAPAGAAQEANEILLDFPTSREELFEYDCLVAFDPSWTDLTVENLRMLDEWVAEKAGGLILVAGPVHTPQWSRGRHSSADEEKIGVVRDLYPVTFYRSGAATIQLGRAGSDRAWPLAFSPEGQRAPFLWLDESPAESELAWKEFEGVYGYQALRGIKPGAQVYARFSDPQSATTDEQPVYLAGQFYGTGRTLYMGSGEMWRLNAINVTYFEKLYTKLIRHVSQGRLLRDSSRGILLVDKEKAQIGDTVSVRASLSDRQYQPLTLEEVEGLVTAEDGSQQPLVMRRLTNSERPGMYSGQFTTTREGNYRVELMLPDSEDEVLAREVKVRLPAREIENSQRNDPLLSSLADQTGGRYFVGLASTAAADESEDPQSWAESLLAKDQVTLLPGTPDPAFERRLMTWLLTGICGALCLEWLTRRLFRLA